MITAALAAGFMLVLGLAMAGVLCWANRAFHVEVDPKVDALNAALPGANCGGCGFVGCGEYAEAMAAGKAEVTLCGPGGAGCAAKLASIMGVEVGEQLPYRAVVHCSATRSQRKLLFEYRGEGGCAAANLVSGMMGCVYGCLGEGDCMRSCKYDAIRIRDGLAEINYHNCIGCKACAKACPRNIITMVPFKAERMFVTKCSNKDPALAVREVCTTGCIGCKLCGKLNSLFTVENNLVGLDYDKYDPATVDFTKVQEKCPMGSLTWIGKPTEADKAAVAHEKLPGSVEADFKTTVDQTEWWG
jgi:Na+-translocating ferredoxin:NAD+ oxidoreductase RNF subunit RnfB